ncbi:MAG: ATP-binding protein [candidate division WOR-3 bacterium]
MRWLTIAFLLVSGCIPGPPVEVTLLWERPSPAMVAADLDADSADELLVYDTDCYIVGRDQKLQVMSPSRRFTQDSRRAGLPWAASETLIWAPRVRNDSLLLAQLWQDRELFCCEVPRQAANDFWDGAVIQAEVADISGDSQPELVVAVQAGFSRWPRGIFALDIEKGSRLWEFHLGPNPDRFLLRDVNQDGRSEIFVGTIAPGNGHIIQGTDDSYTFVLCLKHDGTLLWQRRVGDYGQAAAVGWFDGRLLVYEQGLPLEGAGPDSVFLLDPSSGAIVASAQTGRFGRGAAAFEDDGLLVTASSDDTLRVHDRFLRVIHRRFLGKFGATSICPGSFTGPGRRELAVATTSGSLLLFDERFRQTASTNPGGVSRMFPLDHEGRQRLLVCMEGDPTSVWRLYEFNRLPLLSRQVSVGVLFAGVSLLIAAFAVVLLGVRYRQARDIRTVVRGLTGQAGVIELDQRGAASRMNPKARELLGSEKLPDGPLAQAARAMLAEPVGAQPKEMPVVLAAGKTVLARVVRVRRGVLVTLEDISAVEYMRRVTAWVPLAQRLAHDIKNPLTVISLALQRLEQQAVTGGVKHVETARAEIDRLRRMADGFMRLTRLETPKPEPADLNEVIQACLAKFGSVRPAGITVVLDLAGDLPAVPLDREQILTALTNIIENGFAAMGQTGTLSVTTRAGEDGRTVTVTIADTGAGIPERYLSKVFEPFFTMKQGGTGLGMCLTKRIVDDHKGSIAVHSTEGKGTTFTITLPALSNSGTRPA